ncbi:hypothetical protein ACFRR7_36845 [Streptomyces sp. NPDC056909]|uniref:hypothetical protein n=1 Tax=Streptomyces sp. NPDC056909 TaxID=3345963 RepID=UPI0036CDC01B
MLQRLVGADPAAWTADAPGCSLPWPGQALGVFYLAAAAAAAVARRRGAFPAGPVPAALAALTLPALCPAPRPANSPPARWCSPTGRCSTC